MNSGKSHERARLAERLVEADNTERAVLIASNSVLADVQLAYQLKDVCLDGWSNHPAQAIGAAQSLKILSQENPHPEIAALSAWTSGLELLVHGQMEEALGCLEESERRFSDLNLPQVSAATQVTRLVALAMLGRYEEAVESGLRAREVFLANDDQLTAGKIEHNVGNIYFRRDQYREAEQLQRSARQRFLEVGDEVQITKIENSLALTLSQQHRIRAAETLYQQALERAARAGLTTTQAEIESSIGMLALSQGQYDRALDFLERSRRRYSDLDMPHVSALTEQEIADAYLELNLVPEAIEIYERVTPKFAEAGMRAEQARASSHQGRAALMLGRPDEARSWLGKARQLYAAEDNKVAAALIGLTEAQLHYAEQNYAAAQQAVTEVEPMIAASSMPRSLLFARWLHGEIMRCEGLLESATEMLNATLAAANSDEQPDIAARCLTSLGLAEAAAGDRVAAEQHLKAAVEIIEQLRAPLPAEEFRSAFFASKLVPYNELARLCLADVNDRVAEALGYVERARSRALVDTLGGAGALQPKARDAFEARLITRLEDLRRELNYFYSQMNQPGRGGEVRSEGEKSLLQTAVRERETQTLETMRQLQHRGNSASYEARDFDLDRLRESLGGDRALIEYAAIDDQLLAFVVTDQNVEVVRDLGTESEAAANIAQFRFQIDTLRYGSSAARRHLPTLTDRARRYLEMLYRQLLLPIESLVGNRHLSIVPYRALHYLPFHALHDGKRYLIERAEVSYAPSAMVLQRCLERPLANIEKALLVGVTDGAAVKVRDEIENVRQLFPGARVFMDDGATLEAITRESVNADLVHLACHAQFRADNPLFSSLRLGNGWMTVRDAYNLKLGSRLVTLSACETGVNAISPGEELIGLARGFISAGSPSVLISLWTVDDEATAQLMTDFYTNLRRTNSLSQSLRLAQLQGLTKEPHPFFWSPFVLVGRW